MQSNDIIYIYRYILSQNVDALDVHFFNIYILYTYACLYMCICVKKNIYTCTNRHIYTYIYMIHVHVFLFIYIYRHTF